MRYGVDDARRDIILVTLAFGLPIAGFATLSACASWFATLPAQSAKEQTACVAEAGTKAEAEACVCAVRAKYAEAGDTPCDGGAP